MLKPEIVDQIVAALDDDAMSLEAQSETLDRIIPAEIQRKHCYIYQPSSNCSRAEEYKRCVIVTDTKTGHTERHCSSSWSCTRPSGLSTCDS